MLNMSDAIKLLALSTHINQDHILDHMYCNNNGIDSGHTW